MRKRRRRSSGSNILLGLMSGTSADGIDVAAVRIRGLRMRPEFVDHLHRTFPPKLHRRLLAVMAPARTSTEEIACLHTELGHAFAEAARAMIDRLGVKNRPVAIGLAGQTVCHLPVGVRPPQRTTMATGGRHKLRTQNSELETVTLQLGNAHLVAARTGIPVIADFRQSDVAAGGQGAPLVPWTDWVLFRDARQDCAVQNIGGIANVTYIPAGGRPEDVIAFDTGPGNMVIAALVQHITRGRQRMDRDGRRARRGRVLTAVLDRWLKHPFFQLPPPRTTGRETFGRVFLEAELPRLRRASDKPDDWVATATAFTAATIAESYPRFLSCGASAQRDAGVPPARCGTGVPPVWPSADVRSAVESKHSRSQHGTRGPDPPVLMPGKSDSRSRARQQPPLSVILCGGGARNPALRAFLADAMPAARIRTIDEYGIPAEAKEAMSFAILARAALDRVPANLPQATGAAHPACLGVRVDPP